MFYSYLFVLPQVVAEFLWESSARVMVDFGVGGGMALRSALTLHVKVVGVCFNADHLRVVKANTTKWIHKQLDERKGDLCPANFDARLESARDPREVLWASQKRKNAARDGSPNPKRHAAARLDGLLDDLYNPGPSGSHATPKKNASPETSGAKPKPSAPEPKQKPKPAPETKPSEEGGEENPEELKKLLEEWGSS